MKFDTAHKQYLDEAARGWYKWFAWYPVEVDPETTVWLQYVERRITGLNDSRYFSSATYEYRNLPITKNI